MKKLLLVLLCLPMISFGQCEGDCENGRCIITYTNAEYVGDCKDSEPNGYGELIFNDTEQRYIGNWLVGNKHGEGKLIIDGDLVYEGYWKENKRNGLGTSYYRNGQVWSGLWLDGEQLEGHYETENYYDKNHISGDVDFSIINLHKLVDVNGEGCYNITLSFNGINEEFLFDTGCSSMLINYDLLQRLKANGMQIKQLKQGEGTTASEEKVKTDQFILNNIKVGDYIINNLVVDVIETDMPLCGIGLFKKFSNVEWNMTDATLKLYK